MTYSDISLPKAWPRRVKSALLHAVSLAHVAITYSRSWCADSPLIRVRQAGELNRANQEIAMLKEEIRIKDTRTARIPPHQRPFYPPTERLATCPEHCRRVHALRAARGWNLAQTARAFLVEPATISSWMKRLDEDGEQALVKLPTPVNKHPDFIALVVQQLKFLCPVMGKKRIAQILARLGLQLSASSAGRFLKQKHQPPDHLQTPDPFKPSGRTVIAKYSNHVWHVDLTVVPTQTGFWTAWLPFSLPQVWPFCYWVALVMDHFSRRIMGFAVFKYPPSSLQIRSFLTRSFRLRQVFLRRSSSYGGQVAGHVHVTGHVPKYIISDKGSQFWNYAFKQWCKRRKVIPRFGAVGRYGSIALIERCIRSMKAEYARQIILPLRQSDMRYELGLYINWYNEIRPHQSLDGRTPQEIYDGFPVSQQKHEIRGKNGVKLKLSVSYFKGRKHLPVVNLEKAA